MNDRRPLYVLAALVTAGVIALIFTSVSDGSSSGSQDTTTTAVSKRPTTTIRSTTPTTKAAAPDWRAAFDRVIAVQNELLQNPDPARVDEIIDKSCPCYAETRQGIQTLKDRGWRVQGKTLDPILVSLADENSGLYTITVSFKGTGSPTVDGNGKVVEAGKTGNLQPVRYVLQHKNSGVWLVVDRRVYEEREQ